ncbi:glycoside hydrolase family 27 protein [Antrihabitans cavernicola]|uniref:Alpha-galactosidase n=1 Tax=Antrihabitans cavernicola TaxID=2495913 RepID=A0A5A7S5A0_9NOCA|nr:glycoside hydrolase family 27 protein [Spelaeibacter cavernicola]KAA0018080.1 glycoside hydrolase family 27 protein [Spelaeibacter cavernicola]
MIGRAKGAGVAAVLAATLAVSTASDLPAVADTGPAIAGVAALPPLGWNSWNTFGCNIDETVIEHAADAMVASGMRDAGYDYVVVDDCWYSPQRAPDGQLQADPTRFPSGMAALADYVHARGLKFGIYAGASDRTCAQLGGAYPGSTGSEGYEAIDAATFASWGVDYLKYDWCSTDSSTTRQQAAFTAMRNALRATGRPIVYSINPNSGVAGTPPGATYDWSHIATMARTTNDVSPAWTTLWGEAGPLGVLDILDTHAPTAGGDEAGWWADPDMLEVGVPGLTPAEERTQFATWAMMSAPLIAGNDLDDMSAATRAVLTNPRVLAVDQDTAARPPRSLPNDPQIRVKALADGSIAVSFTNTADSARQMTITATQIGLPSYVVEDLWTGTRRDGAGALSIDVAPHDTAIVRIAPHS